MITSRGSSGGAGLPSIPAGSRKMVQSLKEIVRYPETEIYAALKDCNMDPNEAVNRLLSQDPFHEVKSKREKKKEFWDHTLYFKRTYWFDIYKFAGSIKNQYYNKSLYDEVRSEWSEFVYSYVGA